MKWNITTASYCYPVYCNAIVLLSEIALLKEHVRGLEKADKNISARNVSIKHLTLLLWTGNILSFLVAELLPERISKLEDLVPSREYTIEAILRIILSIYSCIYYSSWITAWMVQYSCRWIEMRYKLYKPTFVILSWSVWNYDCWRYNDLERRNTCLDRRKWGQWYYQAEL